MNKPKSNQTRRDFIKGVGAASMGLLLPEYSKVRKQENIVNTKESIHRIMTCNIRVALDEDEEKGVGWNARKNICASVIKNQDPDIICLQEVIEVQMADMKDFFPGYASYGFEGPEMDKLPGGYQGIAKNPIMYLKEKYELISCGCFWLSEEPLIGGSKSWGTARARNANWLRLKDIDSSKEFRIVNTHLDHISQDSREKQINLILFESGQYQDDFPQILSGDFNADDKNPVARIIEENGWFDTYKLAHGAPYSKFTGHGFLGEGSKSTKGPIDFIFSHGNIKTHSAEIIKDNVKGSYPSDHYFIMAVIELN